MNSDPVTPNEGLVEKVMRTRTAGRAENLMRSRFGTGLLVTISTLESFLPVPIITDPFLAAAIMINRSRAAYLVFITMVSSVVGGFAAYLVAVLFRELLLATLTPDMVVTLHSFVEGNESGTFLLTIVGAITPVPYTIIAWAVALTDGNPLSFILGSIVGRSFRYGVVGWCTYRFGPAALALAKRSILLTSGAIFVLVAIYLLLKM